jgi:transcriptional regulator with XRE-family HTH domain
MELPLRADLLASKSIAQEEELGARLQQQIGLNLRHYRTMRGLTVESLAQHAGVDLDALRAAESGEAMPSLGLLWKVAPVLDVSCLALTGESEDLVDMSHRTNAQPNVAADRR